MHRRVGSAFSPAPRDVMTRMPLFWQYPIKSAYTKTRRRKDIVTTHDVQYTGLPYGLLKGRGVWYNREDHLVFTFVLTLSMQSNT
jgi:hypothetical protein